MTNKMEYTYAALLLHKLGKDITEDNVKSVVAAAGAEVDDSKVKSLVSSLKGVDIAKELENATPVTARAGSPTGGASEAPAEKKEEKPKEKEKAPAAEGLSALFG